MKKHKIKRIILCPTCKTGAESYKLDELSAACPYISGYNGMSCPYYAPIKKEPENKFYDKLMNMIKRKK